MNLDQPTFSPTGANFPQVATTTSVSFVLPGTEGYQLRVIHVTTGSVAFIAFGFGAPVVATNADLPMLGGTQKIFSLPMGVTHLGVIVTSGTPTLHFQRGTGV